MERTAACYYPLTSSEATFSDGEEFTGITVNGHDVLSVENIDAADVGSLVYTLEVEVPFNIVCLFWTNFIFRPKTRDSEKKSFSQFYLQIRALSMLKYSTVRSRTLRISKVFIFSDPGTFAAMDLFRVSTQFQLDLFETLKLLRYSSSHPN